MATYRYNVGVTWPGMGSPGVNVWHFRTDNDPNDFSDGPIAIIRDFYEDIAPLFPATLDWDGPSEVIEDPYGDPTFRAVDPWHRDGTGGSTMGSRAVQACVTWRTQSATRSGRGRTFLGPLSQTSVDSATGRLITGLVGPLRDAAAALVSANGNVLNGAVGVYSREQHLLRDITSYAVRDVPAVLRSRRD